MRRRQLDVASVGASGGDRGTPSLVFTVGAVVLVDTALYSVLAPLLPGLVHELRLSKLSAGLLTASYAIGTLIGSLPGGILVVRAGPKRAVLTGLALLLCSTVAFAFLRNVAALDAARLLEGFGGACSWAGGLAWIVTGTAPERRGEMMGRAISAAIAGALLGPVLGTLATAIGRPAAFSGLAVAVGLLIAWMRALPSVHVPSGQGVGAVIAALRRPDVAIGLWLMTLPAISSGLINVLGPLRLHQLGGTAVAIGGAFLAAAAVEAVASPAAGGLSDRRGRLFPLRLGLAATSVVLLCFTLPDTVTLLIATLVVIAAALGFFWAPSMALLADAAGEHGLDQGLAAALMNIGWAAGQIIGSAGGGAVAKVAGDAVPMAVAAGLCALTFAGLSLIPGLQERLNLPAAKARVSAGTPSEL